MKAINTKKSESVIIRNKNIERYLKEIKTPIKFTALEERNLIISAQTGNIQARNMLAKAHLRFIVSCAKEYQIQGVEMGDLIGAGNEGLILAIEKYDLRKDVRFITCAVWWVRFKLLEYVKQTFSLIQIPLNQQSELKKLTMLKEKLDKEAETDLTFGQVLAKAEDLNYDFNYVRPSIICSRNLESLDSSIKDEEGETTLYNLLSSEITTDSVLEKEDRVKIIKNYLEKLSFIQKEVIILYYGLNDRIEKTDSDISYLLNIKNLSAERVRQIRLKGIEKLRNTKILKNFY